jgi:hypothetical protein
MQRYVARAIGAKVREEAAPSRQRSERVGVGEGQVLEAEQPSGLLEIE